MEGRGTYSLCHYKEGINEYLQVDEDFPAAFDQVVQVAFVFLNAVVAAKTVGGKCC